VVRSKKNDLGHTDTTKITTDQSELADVRQQPAVSNTAGGGSGTRVRQREGSNQEALPGIQPIGSAQQPESRTDEATPRVLSLTPVQESAVSKGLTSIRLTPEHLPLPKRGKSILAQIAWPGDADRREFFLERCSAPRNALSRAQLLELRDAARADIDRQLERWGFPWWRVGIWLQDPYTDSITEKGHGRACRDAIKEATHLKMLLFCREFIEFERRHSGPRKGHAVQRTGRQARAVLIREKARKLRVNDNHKSKTALARQLSRAVGRTFGWSASTILRVAGDLLEKITTCR